MTEEHNNVALRVSLLTLAVLVSSACDTPPAAPSVPPVEPDPAPSAVSVEVDPMTARVGEIITMTFRLAPAPGPPRRRLDRSDPAIRRQPGGRRTDHHPGQADTTHLHDRLHPRQLGRYLDRAHHGRTAAR